MTFDKIAHAGYTMGSRWWSYTSFGNGIVLDPYLEERVTIALGRPKTSRCLVIAKGFLNRNKFRKLGFPNIKRTSLDRLLSTRTDSLFPMFSYLFRKSSLAVNALILRTYRLSWLVAEILSAAEDKTWSVWWCGWILPQKSNPNALVTHVWLQQGEGR